MNKKTKLLGLVLSLVTLGSIAFRDKGGAAGTRDGTRVGPDGTQIAMEGTRVGADGMRPAVPKDSAASVKAFRTVYAVLTSPRCMNCHPAGDIPLQGDDSHLHTMMPQRGLDGKGVYAMKCANCHQPTNTPGFHTPPGNPKWQLPPSDMRMVFQGRTPRELALQLLDRKRNGNKDMQALLQHASDTLVVAAWHPGEGRTLPPVSHAEFKKAWTEWLTKGAFAPAK